MMIDAETLRSLLDYDPNTGSFRWKERQRACFSRDNQWRNWNARYPGTIAGAITAKGYCAIRVMWKTYPAHRLAWLYEHGAWPEGQIDHINGDRADNRISNLRDVSGAENAKNRRLQRGSATGYAGVTKYGWHGRLRYVARIRVGGRLHHLGYFDTVEGAVEARAVAERQHGFHPNHGTKRPLKGCGFAKSRDWSGVEG